MFVLSRGYGGRWAGRLACRARRSALFRAGKFAEQQTRGSNVSLVGGLGRREAAEIALPPVFSNLCDPLAATSVERDALESRRVASVAPSIGTVVRMGRWPQIGPPVVERVAITMIDHRPAPLAFHVKPSQLVCPVVAAVDMNGPILRSHARAREIACLDVWSHAHPPAKFPALGIVVQQL